MGRASERSTPGQVGKAVADRLGDGVGLLVDLLEHEGLVAALLGRVGVPAWSPRSRARSSCRRRVKRCPGASTVTISSFSTNLARCGSRARKAGIAKARKSPLAQPDDQRALLASPDEQVGLVSVHRHEGVVAAKLREGGGHRRRSGRRRRCALDQVGDDLGVGVGAEDVALAARASRRSAWFSMIPLRTMWMRSEQSHVRMGVLLGDAAVGRPARVRDAGGGRRGRGNGDRGLPVLRGKLELAGRAGRPAWAPPSHGVDAHRRRSPRCRLSHSRGTQASSKPATSRSWQGTLATYPTIPPIRPQRVGGGPRSAQERNLVER